MSARLAADMGVGPAGGPHKSCGPLLEDRAAMGGLTRGFEPFGHLLDHVMRRQLGEQWDQQSLGGEGIARGGVERAQRLRQLRHLRHITMNHGRLRGL